MSREPVDLRERLSEVARLLRHHRNHAQAKVVECLVELYVADRERFWSALDQDEMWGGRGSVAEGGLADADGTEPERLARDRRAFFEAMVGIAREMDNRGVNNPRAQLWAQRFTAETGTSS